MRDDNPSLGHLYYWNRYAVLYTDRELAAKLVKNFTEALRRYRSAHRCDGDSDVWAQQGLSFSDQCGHRIPFVHRVLELGGKDGLLAATEGLAEENKRAALLMSGVRHHTTLHGILYSGGNESAAVETLLAVLKGSTTEFLDSVFLHSPPYGRWTALKMAAEMGEGVQRAVNQLYGEAVMRSMAQSYGEAAVAERLNGKVKLQSGLEFTH